MPAQAEDKSRRRLLYLAGAFAANSALSSCLTINVGAPPSTPSPTETPKPANTPRVEPTKPPTAEPAKPTLAPPTATVAPTAQPPREITPSAKPETKKLDLVWQKVRGIPGFTEDPFVESLMFSGRTIVGYDSNGSIVTLDLTNGNENKWVRPDEQVVLHADSDFVYSTLKDRNKISVTDYQGNEKFPIPLQPNQRIFTVTSNKTHIFVSVEVQESDSKKRKVIVVDKSKPDKQVEKSGIVFRIDDSYFVHGSSSSEITRLSDGKTLELQQPQGSTVNAYTNLIPGHPLLLSSQDTKIGQKTFFGFDLTQEKVNWRLAGNNLSFGSVTRDLYIFLDSSANRRRILAVNPTDGKEVWSEPINYNYTAVYGLPPEDKIVATVDEDGQSFAIVHDLKTGKLVWPTSYPAAIRHQIGLHEGIFLGSKTTSEKEAYLENLYGLNLRKAPDRPWERTVLTPKRKKGPTSNSSHYEGKIATIDQEKIRIIDASTGKEVASHEPGGTPERFQFHQGLLLVQSRTSDKAGTLTAYRI